MNSLICAGSHQCVTAESGTIGLSAFIAGLTGMISSRTAVLKIVCRHAKARRTVTAPRPASVSSATHALTWERRMSVSFISPSRDGTMSWAMYLR